MLQLFYSLIFIPLALVGRHLYEKCLLMPILLFIQFYYLFNNRVSDNQRAQDAINVTLFHWGIHGWIVYAIVGLALGMVSHRQGLPMTIRSCFYPLLGDRIFGFMGDIIEIVAIVSTMFGVCASLGAGAMTMNSGLNQLNDSIEMNTANQTIVIWVITFFATMSVVSGLRLGIRRLSEICFVLGIFIMLIILFCGETFFLLNLYVQSIGYYIQNVIQLGFHTDAYAQLGNAPDKKEDPQWMHNWTIAYWGWWISWSPFVGMFIAKISKGRTVRNFINSTLTAPIMFTFLWFVVVGGSGINMEREAALKGIECDSRLGGGNSTEPFEGLYRLHCRAQSQMYFDLIQQYGGVVGKFLRLLSLVSILLYFVTSSDSGSLVIDCLSANGSPDPPVTQRVFWALTEGATATALLTAGGKRAIDAVLAAAVASGLPFAPILSLLCVSLWRIFKSEYGDVNDNEKEFHAGLLEIIDNPSTRNCQRILLAIVAPWWPAGRAAGKLYNKHPWRYMLIMAVLFYTWFLLIMLYHVEENLMFVGWAVLCGFFAYVVGIRSSIRQFSGIQGNLVEDALTMLVYFLAVDQLDKHMSIELRQKKNDPQPLMEFNNKNSSNSSAEEIKIEMPNDSEAGKCLVQNNTYV
jgi:choline-glycine betaine transporter